MFEATLRRRDPEALYRWVGTVLVVGAIAFTLALSMFSALLLKLAWYLLSWLLFATVGGPVPVWEVRAIEIVEAEIIEEWEPLDDQAFVVVEPEDLLGEAPPPPPRVVETESLAPLPSTRIASIRGGDLGSQQMLVMGVLGTMESSGEVADIFADGGSLGGDLAVLGGSGLAVASRGGEASLGGLGSGGGGRAEGIGSISSTRRAPTRSATGVSEALKSGERVRCTVTVDPEAEVSLAVSNCPRKYYSEARKAVTARGFETQPGPVRVLLKGAR